jgi:hypothetical protein
MKKPPQREDGRGTMNEEGEHVNAKLSRNGMPSDL